MPASLGARYYSAYLGRWLSPDPPVVHGSAAGANYFQFAANAPYIAIDPDGRWVNVLIGAIVGSIVGSANEIIKRGGIRSIANAGWVTGGGRGTGHPGYAVKVLKRPSIRESEGGV